MLVNFEQFRMNSWDVQPGATFGKTWLDGAAIDQWLLTNEE